MAWHAAEQDRADIGNVTGSDVVAGDQNKGRNSATSHLTLTTGSIYSPLIVMTPTARSSGYIGMDVGCRQTKVFHRSHHTFFSLLYIAADNPSRAGRGPRAGLCVPLSYRLAETPGNCLFSAAVFDAPCRLQLLAMLIRLSQVTPPLSVWYVKSYTLVIE